MNIDDRFPDLLGTDQNGSEVRLSSYPENFRFIVYFYPKDSTPGCTLEARSLSEAYKQFLDMGYQVIGVSAGDEKSHQRFIAKNDIPFPLVADTGHQLCETAGVWQLKKLVSGKIKFLNIHCFQYHTLSFLSSFKLVRHITTIVTT